MDNYRVLIDKKPSNYYLRIILGIYIIPIIFFLAFINFHYSVKYIFIVFVLLMSYLSSRTQKNKIYKIALDNKFVYLGYYEKSTGKEIKIRWNDFNIIKEQIPWAKARCERLVILINDNRFIVHYPTIVFAFDTWRNNMLPFIYSFVIRIKEQSLKGEIDFDKIDEYIKELNEYL